jgi:hypothetical protein
MDGLQLNLKVNQFWICMRISLERSLLIAERFLQQLIKKYGKYPSPLLVVVVHGIHKHVDF